MLKLCSRILFFFFGRLGMALAPWDVLASGKLRTYEEEARREETGERGRVVERFSPEWRRSENERKVSHALEKVAGVVSAKHITSG